MQKQNLDDILIRRFFKFQHELKLFHWRTQSYAKHKASDKLFSKIIELIDDFIETYMGKFKKRIEFNSNQGILIKTFTDKNINNLLESFAQFLTNLDKKLPKNSSDLINIRDEMLSNVNKTLYLFSLH
jgi:hypothetical protein